MQLLFHNRHEFVSGLRRAGRDEVLADVAGDSADSAADDIFPGFVRAQSAQLPVPRATQRLQRPAAVSRCPLRLV